MGTNVNIHCFIFLFVLFKNSEESARERARERNIFLSPALDGLWRENRGSVNRLRSMAVLSCREPWPVLSSQAHERRSARTSGKALARLYYLTRQTKTVMLRRVEKGGFRSHADVKLLRSHSLHSAFMHQSIPAAPSLPPPRADPQALACFLPWMANSRGVKDSWAVKSPGVGTKKEGKYPVLRQNCNIFHWPHSQRVWMGGGGVQMSVVS